MVVSIHQRISVKNKETVLTTLKELRHGLCILKKFQVRHLQSVLILSILIDLFLPICCLSTLASCYFKVFFSLKVIFLCRQSDSKYRDVAPLKLEFMRRFLRAFTAVKTIHSATYHCIYTTKLILALWILMLLLAITKKFTHLAYL